MTPSATRLGKMHQAQNSQGGWRNHVTGLLRDRGPMVDASALEATAIQPRNLPARCPCKPFLSSSGNSSPTSDKRASSTHADKPGSQLQLHSLQYLEAEALNRNEEKKNHFFLIIRKKYKIKKIYLFSGLKGHNDQESSTDVLTIFPCKTTVLIQYLSRVLQFYFNNTHFLHFNYVSISFQKQLDAWKSNSVDNVLPSLNIIKKKTETLRCKHLNNYRSYQFSQETYQA